MNPNGRTSSVPSVSMATVDRRNLPSRGRSFQKDANERRSRAAEVTERSVGKDAGILQPGLGPVWASRPGGWPNSFVDNR